MNKFSDEILKCDLFRVFVDRDEKILVVEANWQDTDNTEEWFCHLGKDMKNLFYEADYHHSVYTDDRKWYVTANERTGELTVHNVLYDFSVTFHYCFLNATFCLYCLHRVCKEGKNHDNT